MGLAEALDRFARVPVVLVASDYDGVLAPIVLDPAKAYPLPAAIAGLRTLADLPRTKVAVVSGRSLRDLTAVGRLPAGFHLVGGHGWEFDDLVPVGAAGQDQRGLDPAAVALRAALVAELEPLVAGYPGVRLETNPGSVVVHTRTAGRADAAAALDAVRAGPARHPGVRVTEGKEIIELSVVAANKGTALDTLRARLHADAVLYLGDDVTDEDGFARLSGPDIGIKVGPGPTRAGYRVADPAAVVTVLTELADRRRSTTRGGVTG